MVNKEYFEGENYEKFKEEAEQIISDYQAGKYKTEIKEIKVRIENIMRLTNGNPHAYLDICSLYKFLTALYNTSYVKNIIQFTKDLEFSFYLPREMNTNLDMESFASSVLHNRKTHDDFDMNQYFVLSFSKKVNTNEGTTPYLFTIPLLLHTGSLLYSQLSVVRQYDIMSGISHLETLAKA